MEGEYMGLTGAPKFFLDIFKKYAPVDLSRAITHTKDTLNFDNNRRCTWYMS